MRLSHRSAALVTSGLALAAATGWWLQRPVAPQAPVLLPQSAPAIPALAREPVEGSPQVGPIGPAQPEAQVAPPKMTKREVVKDLADRVQHAKEAAKPPPPEIAQARTFQDAFAAMLRAQQRDEAPPAPEAGMNPFGAAQPSR